MIGPQSSRTAARIGYSASGYAHYNIAWNNVARWKMASKKTTGKALENGHRLQSIGTKEGVEPIIADIYSEPSLRRYLQMELAILMTCTTVAVFSGIEAITDTIMLIPLIVSVWVISIAWRFYKQHARRYLHIRSLHSDVVCKVASRGA